jgi:glycosyltransferase involved in cell wall biosynthesis
MANTAPLFSVVMPAYNREKYIGHALSSVLAQTCADWECIVVDDGSSDATRAVVREFASKDQRIRLIERANGGPGAARNHGATEATGKYLSFLDSDDVWTPYTLETYREALEQAGWPEYLSGHLRPFSQDAEVKHWVREPMQADVFPDAIAACRDGAVVAGVGMTVVLADAFRRAGGFLQDRINAEDHDFTLRLGDCRGFAAVRAPVTVAYRRHADQETSNQVKAVAGILRLMARERAGAYPGGVTRAIQRRGIIAAHARPVSLAALQAGEFRLAWQLYQATFAWQLQASTSPQ